MRSCQYTAPPELKSEGACFAAALAIYIQSQTFLHHAAQYSANVTRKRDDEARDNC